MRYIMLQRVLHNNMDMIIYKHLLPHCKITTVRLLMQIAVEYDLIIEYKQKRNDLTNMKRESKKLYYI